MNGLVANFQDEVTILKSPTTISAYEGEFAGGKLERHGLGLTRLQRNLREIAQALVVGHDAGDEIA